MALKSFFKGWWRVNRDYLRTRKEMRPVHSATQSMERQGGLQIEPQEKLPVAPEHAAVCKLGDLLTDTEKKHLEMRVQGLIPDVPLLKPDDSKPVNK